MKKSSLRYPLLTLAIVAAAGCGGSESSDAAGTGDHFAFDASTWQKPGSSTDMTGGGTAGANSGALTPPGPNCGDPTVNPDEECDGTNLGGKTCATATMGASPNGTLACRSNCTFNLTGCSSNGSPGGGSNGAGGGSNGAGGGSNQGTGAGPNTGAGGGP